MPSDVRWAIGVEKVVLAKADLWDPFQCWVSDYTFVETNLKASRGQKEKMRSTVGLERPGRMVQPEAR